MFKKKICFQNIPAEYKVNQILEALRSKKLNVWIDQVPDSNDLASLISGVKAHVDEINA